VTQAFGVTIQVVKRVSTIKSMNQNLKKNIGAVILLLATVIFFVIWMNVLVQRGSITITLVFIAALITALTTGFGAFPFLLKKEIGRSWLGYGNALAGGLMIGASLGLIFEGTQLGDISFPALRTFAGILAGLFLVIVAHRALEKRTEQVSIGDIEGANATKMIMIVGIMTAHSFAEGIGVGVSFGESASLGTLITTAIAIHNIPEGLAISLVLIPRGAGFIKSMWWSVFSSLPQPLMAVPAFLFVMLFKPLLPFGLGLAAGAMLWMVFKELLPEARRELSSLKVYVCIIVTAVGMLVFQMVAH